MARVVRALKRTPAGLGVAIAVVLSLVLIIGAAATLAGILPKPSVAARTYPVPSIEDLNSNASKERATVLTDCVEMSAGNGWVATGTAKNDATKAKGFTVTVFFFDGSKPVNFAQSRVTVPAGQTSPWAAPKQFRTGTATLSCKVVAVS